VYRLAQSGHPFTTLNAYGPQSDDPHRTGLSREQVFAVVVDNEDVAGLEFDVTGSKLVHYETLVVPDQNTIADRIDTAT